MTSYDEAEALILVPRSPVIYKGALLHIYDASLGAHYLGVVKDVSESEPHPVPDTRALEEVLEAVSASRTVSYHEALRAILSPGSPLTFSTSVTVKIGLLGRLCEARDGGLACENLGESLDPSRVVMRSLERPPRPRSIVDTPDPAILKALLGGCLEPAVIGELVQSPGVEVCLDLSRLNTHLAVLGQTGFGKTETVKRIVYEAVRYWWGASVSQAPRGVIVMDLAGEYTGYPNTPPPPAMTLLEAISRLQGVHIPRLTVIIPYDPRYSSARRVEAGLGNVLQLLAAARVSVAALVFGRGRRVSLHAIPSTLLQNVPGVHLRRGGRVALGDARSVEHLLLNAETLVIAAPLPDYMPIEMLEEIGRFNPDADYTSLLHEAAEALGFHGEVYSVTLLALLAKAAARHQNQLQLSVSQLERSFCQELNRQGLRGALTRLYRQLSGGDAPSYPLRPLARLLAGYPRPGSNLADILRRACRGDQAARRRLRRGLSKLVAAMYRLTAPQYGRNTRSALLRRLSRLARMANPYLDERLSRLLAWRAMHGLTIVHLAPPAVGGVDAPLLPWLLHQVFRVAVSRFDSRRRTLIVVEEAHNLAPAREETFSKSILVRYAREGRKWGLGLVIVTQRPAGVDPTILSQAATLIALRLTNPDDIQAVKAGVESVSQELVERLPDLDRGEALVSGFALPERRIPVLVRVKLAGC